MEEYLTFIKKSLKDLSKWSKVHVTLGNEACDLDSVVSALVYGYHLHKTDKNEGTLHVPVLNILKPDYCLRTEVTYFLGKENNIQPDLLTFRGDLDLHKLHAEDKLKITLLDHNIMKIDSDLESCVVEVLDHHKRERPEDNASVNIEMVGSCCTLVANKILSQDTLHMDKLSYTLLHGTILLDTICLSDEAGRNTPLDKEVVRKLEDHLPPVNRKSIFDCLQGAKMDVSDLSTWDLLRKDLKVVKGKDHTVAMCSVSQDIQVFLKSENVESELARFAREQGAQAIIIMTLVVDDSNKAHRQLAVYSTDSALRSQLCLLVSSPDLSLGLDLLPSVLLHTTVYRQDFIPASRKKVLPAVQQLIS